MPGLNLGGLALPRTPISSSVASWVVNKATPATFIFVRIAKHAGQ
jgi:hypothetical protein